MFNLDQNLPVLQQHYQQHGFVSVPNFIDPVVAERLRQEILHLPWEMAYVLNGKPHRIAVTELKRLSAVQYGQLFQQILSEASQKEYSFVYDTYMLVTNYIQNTLYSALLRKYVETICSASVIDFMRALVGDKTIIKADAQASRYLPGHYLKTHDDSGVNANQQRIAAYTLGFSRNWKPDWGGLLHLQDHNQKITNSLIPAFNTLNVFAVPRNHFVSQVANYCPEQRLSIVGWFRSDRN